MSAPRRAGGPSSAVCSLKRKEVVAAAPAGENRRVSEPRPLEGHAAESLRYIRSTMERAGDFTAVPGWGGALVGATALAAAALAAREPRPTGWLLVWLAEALVAGLLGSAAAALKARRSGTRLFAAPGRRFVLLLCVPLVAGAALTPALVVHGAEGLLPATWLLLYGSGVVAGGAFAVPAVRAMGALFLLLGVAAAAFPHLGDALLAAGFGGLHVVFGIFIGRNHGG